MNLSHIDGDSDRELNEGWEKKLGYFERGASRERG